MTAPAPPAVLPIMPLARGATVAAKVVPPGSKSVTNRALLLAAMARGSSVLEGALDSEDTQACAEALRRVGVPVEGPSAAGRIVVESPGGGPPGDSAARDVHKSGTTARFLPPYLALGAGAYALDGVPRMRQRPMGELVDALRDQGVRVDGGPQLPFTVHGRGRLRGGVLQVAGSDSSQPASGLLMAAPFAERPLTLHVRTARSALPYVDMTAALMSLWGVPVEIRSPGVYHVPNGALYRAGTYAIEPDASAAAYFWGLAAVTGGRVATPGIGPGALQGDVAFLDVLRRMGCRVENDGGAIVRGPSGGRLHAVEADMSAMSDQTLTLAALALFADGPTRVWGVRHIRLQETDRIRAIATEVSRLGGRCAEAPDGFTIWPLSPDARGDVVVETYNDHRVAMSFALVGLRRPGVAISNPACVRKTFPDYFEVLQRAISGAT